MSTDPHAIIYYGFRLPEFDDNHESYYDKNGEWQCAKMPLKPSDNSDYHTTEWNEWRERLREWEKSPENIEIAWSGGEDCEAFYLHARGLRKSVEWNEQLPLAGMDTGPQPKADEFLKQFCDQFGIEWRQPGWHLAAWYF